ncbi:hypothetical protein VN97_g767 [Penicillium thymicola]|uniref:Uncharacterized protein n=1 Tax=Penicillium thymicola TaxID=293382 RepID=A0AAI9TS95_PENTH|nr:hypothetical protein VN97_g767 [Penicillium thymicola]
MGLIHKLQAKLELYRLEQRYARRKHRSTFSTGAQYVDGEYVYSGASSPTSTVSKNSTGSWRPSGWGSGNLTSHHRSGLSISTLPTHSPSPTIAFLLVTKIEKLPDDLSFLICATYHQTYNSNSTFKLLTVPSHPSALRYLRFTMSSV